MPSTRKTRQPAGKSAKPAAKTAAKKIAPAKAKPPAKAAAPAKAAPSAKASTKQGEAMSVADVMRALEKAGSEQARKTYLRHGATGPMFGVAFGTLGVLQKRIRVDHELALKLWDTGNVDARNLAMKIADPAVMKPSDMDRWARENGMRMCNLYIGSLASESPHGATR